MIIQVFILLFIIVGSSLITENILNKKEENILKRLADNGLKVKKSAYIDYMMRFNDDEKKKLLMTILAFIPIVNIVASLLVKPRIFTDVMKFDDIDKYTEPMSKEEILKYQSLGKVSSSFYLKSLMIKKEDETVNITRESTLDEESEDNFISTADCLDEELTMDELLRLLKLFDYEVMPGEMCNIPVALVGNFDFIDVLNKCEEPFIPMPHYTGKEIKYSIIPVGIKSDDIKLQNALTTIKNERLIQVANSSEANFTITSEPKNLDLK